MLSTNFWDSPRMFPLFPQIAKELTSLEWLQYYALMILTNIAQINFAQTYKKSKKMSDNNHCQYMYSS